MSEFSQRYCAFLDILGFKARVRSLESSWDQLAFDRLRSCLQFMHDEQHEAAYASDLPIYEQQGDVIVKKELGEPRITYISDCVVISTDRTKDGFKALCNKVTKIWTDLLWDGYFCRGGISAGPLIHETSCVMGSAYMDAYSLEEQASVPRVVIDHKLTEIYDEYPSEFPSHPPTMERASDGYLYLRYFPRMYFPPYVPTWIDFLLRARSHIHSGLMSSDVGVRQKYEHLATEFNFTLDLYRSQIESVVEPLDDR